MKKNEFSSKFLFLTLTVLICNNFNIKAQNTFISVRYGYSIDMPSGYSKESIESETMDAKYVSRKGSSVIVIVRKILANDPTSIKNLTETPNSQWETIPGTKVVKKGTKYIGSLNVFYLQTTDESQPDYTLKLTHYFIIRNKKVYIIAATCDKNDLEEQQILTECLNSFRF